ncbi:hypothetical protein [Senegalia massiliensis]|uniref:hypothetical protein n=1 Tax=Senegalia massiliensis TaxID=1720316 RepID=UPI001031B8D4|nr:hypothetical protein [Senegalia massiliensis]
MFKFNNENSLIYKISPFLIGLAYLVLFFSIFSDTYTDIIIIIVTIIIPLLSFIEGKKYIHIKKNKKAGYISYILGVIFLVAMFYLMLKVEFFNINV